MAAANLPARWTDAEVTLIDAGDRFDERVRLNQLAAGRQFCGTCRWRSWSRAPA
ncbi:hypothetical protein ACWDKQ_11565 [Saccharopolyspora sp. NPDC000995]